MRAGAQATVQGGRHRVFVALVDAGALVATADLRGSADQDEAGQLADLHLRISDLLRDQEAQTLGVWAFEGSFRGLGTLVSTGPKLHAEGVVLAAAGELGVMVTTISPSSVRAAQGVRKNAEAAKGASSAVSGAWPAEFDAAVAAALLA